MYLYFSNERISHIFVFSYHDFTCYEYYIIHLDRLRLMEPNKGLQKHIYPKIQVIKENKLHFLQPQNILCLKNSS